MNNYDHYLVPFISLALATAFLILSCILNRKISLSSYSIKIFAFFLLVASAARPLIGFNDIHAILDELSPNEGNLKLIALYPIKYASLDPEIKLILLTVAATIVAAFTLLRISKHRDLTLISLAFFLFAIQPLLLYHYRQYLGFSFALYSIYLYFSSKQSSFRLFSLLSAVVHPIFLCIPAILLTSSRFYSAKNHRLKIRLRILPTASVSPLSLNIIGVFICYMVVVLVSASSLLSMASKLLPGYAAYADWSSEPASSNLLILAVLAITCLSLRFDDEIIAITMSATIGTLAAINLFQLTTHIYGLSRLGSAMYPLICYCLMSARLRTPLFRYPALLSPIVVFSINIYKLYSYT